MEKPPFKCPLCCSKTFSSKQLLLDHLNGTSETIYCPICNASCSSIIQLVDHLTLDNCQSGNIEPIVFEVPKASPLLLNSTVQNHNIKIYQNDLEANDSPNFTTYTSDSEVNTMYAEMLNKQLSQQSLQSQELELVKENGDGHYMIVTQDSTDGTIVTKQNNDGTISLTSVKDMKMEAIETESPKNETEDSQEEIYSCNTCEVSFSSVIEHIQNFHNDQDVVVEQEPMNGDSDLPIEFGEVESEEVMVTPDKQTARRVITDTGNIVEEPLLCNSDATEQEKPEESQSPPKKVTRVYTKPKAIKSNEKIIPYHKVMAKKVPKDDGFTIIYECLMCKLKCSNNLEEFKAHACRISKYCCTQCPSTYNNPKSLCAHMKVHKEKQVNNAEMALTFECEVCCTIFPTNKSLKLHKRMHDPIKSRPIDPPVENTDGTIVSEKRYLCSVCNKMIPVDYRTIHQASHKATDKINCDICNKKFTSHEYLEMHMNVHNVDKVTVTKQDESLPYNCLYCHRRFARPHEKVKHERIHTGEKPHSCEICGKSFRVSYCLTLHMRTHTGARPYVCNICGKRFKAHSGYNHHLLTHSEVRAYKCPFCPKAFKTAVQLAGHKNSHTKPFSCQQCNRPFASLYAVRVHTETHARQNNLKFSCRLCGASYARAFAVKDHVKQAHKDELDKLDPAELEKEWSADPPEEMQVLSEDLQEEIPDLKIDSTEHELIIP